MKREEQKEKAAKDNVVRSIDEFNKRFYPKPLKTENGLESPDPEDVAEKLARESLDRLQAALSSK
jgi:hypothetical protein